MKNVLLATTALVFTAGFAAAEVTMGATASLEYGNWDTSNGANAWAPGVEVAISGTGEASGISYSAGLDIDEAGTTIGAITMSSAGFSVTYHANELDGVDNEAGDWVVAYSNGGISASYENDVESDQMLAKAGYTTGALTLGASLENAGAGDVMGVSASYAMGNITVAASADDADNWDASLAYAMGDTTVTVSTDESEVHGIAVATTMNGLSLAASYNTDEEITASVGYTMGDLGVAVAYDSTNEGGFGDDAETILTVTYDLGDIDLEFQANDQEEMHATASFTF